MPVYGLQGQVSEEESGERVGRSQPTAAPTRAPTRTGQESAFPDDEAAASASEAGGTEDGFGEGEHPEPETAPERLAAAFPTGLAMGLPEEMLDAILTEAGGSRRVSVKDIASIPMNSFEKVLENAKIDGDPLSAILMGKAIQWHEECAARCPPPPQRQPVTAPIILPPTAYLGGFFNCPLKYKKRNESSNTFSNRGMTRRSMNWTKKLSAKCGKFSF